MATVESKSFIREAEAPVTEKARASVKDIPLLLKPGEGRGRAVMHVVADYGVGDAAFGEVRDRLLATDRDDRLRDIGETSVPPFNTTATGLWVAQHALEGAAPNRFVYQNTAPRGIEGLQEIKWSGHDDQPFALGLTDNDVPILGVHAGYNFSGVKDRLVGFWKVNVPNGGTQFRSRDNYPASLDILRGDQRLVGEELSIEAIPDLPESNVGYVDGYGNIKTTRRIGSLLEDEAMRTTPIVEVRTNGERHFALNTFYPGVKAEHGQLFIARGSTGGEKDDRFVEVNVMSGQSAPRFRLENGRVRDNLGIEIKPVLAPEK